MQSARSYMRRPAVIAAVVLAALAGGAGMVRATAETILVVTPMAKPVRATVAVPAVDVALPAMQDQLDPQPTGVRKPARARAVIRFTCCPSFFFGPDYPSRVEVPAGTIVYACSCARRSQAFRTLERAVILEGRSYGVFFGVNHASQAVRAEALTVGSRLNGATIQRSSITRRAGVDLAVQTEKHASGGYDGGELFVTDADYRAAVRTLTSRMKAKANEALDDRMRSGGLIALKRSFGSSSTRGRPASLFTAAAPDLAVVKMRPSVIAIGRRDSSAIVSALRAATPAGFVIQDEQQWRVVRFVSYDSSTKRATFEAETTARATDSAVQEIVRSGGSVPTLVRTIRARLNAEVRIEHRFTLVHPRRVRAVVRG